MYYGYDLKSEYPISEELYYKLTYHVIPHIYACNMENSHEIKIYAPTVNSELEGDWVGTGISCGVDSLSVVYEYTRQIELEDYKLTHLVYLKIGQHAEAYGYNEDVEKRHFDDGRNNAMAFAKKIGLPIIIGESNLNQLLTEAFGYKSLLPSHVFRNLGSIMILQNHFAKYFYATTFGNLSSFKMDINGDVAYSERWLIPLISNESIKFYSASRALDRVAKTKLLANFPECYDHLSVCWRGTKGCGYCKKCIRTMTTLDLFGVLDKFRNIFNDMYRERKRDLFAFMYLERKKDYFFGEIMQYMEKNNLRQTSISDILHLKMMQFKDTRYPLCQTPEWKYSAPVVFLKKMLRFLIGKAFYEKLKSAVKGHK